MSPSGAGKTTLLRLIGGQIRASSGMLNAAGQDIGHLKRRDLYVLRQRMA